MAYLEILSGKHKGKYVDLTSTVQLGRNLNNALPLDDPLASRNHAQISQDGSSFFLEDLNSRNGTILSGNKISPASLCELTDGDQITISITRFRFRTSDVPVAVAQPTIATPSPPEETPSSPEARSPNRPSPSTCWI